MCKTAPHDPARKLLRRGAAALFAATAKVRETRKKGYASMEIAGPPPSETPRSSGADLGIDAFAPVRLLLKALLVAFPALLGLIALWAASRS